MKRILLTTFCLVGLLSGLVAPAGAASLNDVIRTLETPFQRDTAVELRINDYTADFFQESEIAALDRVQRARGRVEVAFDYARQQTVPTVRFRWQYDQPTTQEIVSNGKTLWVYLPENNQVIQSDIEQVNQARENDPMTFLTGLGNLSRDFQISWGTPNLDIDGNHILNLTPRRVSQLISRMVMVVDRYAVDAFLARQANRTQDRPAIPAPPSAIQTPIPPRIPTFPGPSGFPFPGFSGPDSVWFPILSTTVFDPNGNSTTIEFSNLRVNIGITPLSFEFLLPAGVEVVRPTGQGMGF